MNLFWNAGKWTVAAVTLAILLMLVTQLSFPCWARVLCGAAQAAVTVITTLRLGHLQLRCNEFIRDNANRNAA